MVRSGAVISAAYATNLHRTNTPGFPLISLLYNAYCNNMYYANLDNTNAIDLSQLIIHFAGVSLHNLTPTKPIKNNRNVECTVNKTETNNRIDKWPLNSNPLKQHLDIFKHKINPQSTKNQRLNIKKPPKQCEKYLGIYIAKTINFNCHCRYCKQKVLPITLYVRKRTFRDK